MKLGAIKDGKGNIVISEESFINLINSPGNYATCKKILDQNYIFNVTDDGYFLSKRYELQNEDTEWTGNDVGLVYELFKDTKIVYERRSDLIHLDGSEKIKQGDEPLGKTADGWIAVEPEPRPWLIERPMMYDGQYLTISEDGRKNRPWKKEEVENIEKLFNNGFLKIDIQGSNDEL